MFAFTSFFCGLWQRFPESEPEEGEETSDILKTFYVKFKTITRVFVGSVGGFGAF